RGAAHDGAEGEIEDSRHRRDGAGAGGSREVRRVKSGRETDDGPRLPRGAGGPHASPRRSFSRWICAWIISSVIPPDENVANACIASAAPQAARGHTNQVTWGE